jgi:hypothetical protein
MLSFKNGILCAQVIAQSPPNNFPIEQIDNYRKVKPTLFGLDIGNIAYPNLILSVYFKALV